MAIYTGNEIYKTYNLYFFVLSSQNFQREVRMNKVIKTIDYIIDLSGIFASLCIFFTCFFVSWGVIARYFYISAHWVEPVTIYMFIATAFLTISYTMKKNEHVRVDILTSKLSDKTQKILETILMSFCVIFKEKRNMLF